MRCESHVSSLKLRWRVSVINKSLFFTAIIDYFYSTAMPVTSKSSKASATKKSQRSKANSRADQWDDNESESDKENQDDEEEDLVAGTQKRRKAISIVSELKNRKKSRTSNG